MNTNKKSQLWVYAVILFTSAFIVLLFTAYSQIKMNKNLNDYKSQIYNKESEKNKVQQNFSSAQEMNAKLNEDIKKLEEEKSFLQTEISTLEEDLASRDKMIQTRNDAVTGFSDAIMEYLNGNVVACAALLKNVDVSSLESKTSAVYQTLAQKVDAEAGKLLFDEGFALYNRAKYGEAAGKLLLSFQYAPSEKFSDKCLYYLAYAEVKSDNTALALEHMGKLVSNYPSSKYLNSAKRFIEKYKQ